MPEIEDSLELTNEEISEIIFESLDDGDYVVFSPVKEHEGLDRFIVAVKGLDSAPKPRMIGVIGRKGIEISRMRLILAVIDCDIKVGVVDTDDELTFAKLCFDYWPCEVTREARDDLAKAIRASMPTQDLRDKLDRFIASDGSETIIRGAEGTTLQ